MAAVARVGSRSLLLSGTVTDFDVHAPGELLARSRDAVAALAALTSYTIRNAADLAAFARDLAAGRLPSRLPPRRVLMRLRPDRAMLLDGSALLSTQGEWAGRVSAPDDSPALPGDVDCMVGVETEDGVAVLPGRADANGAGATVAAVAAQLTGAPTDHEVEGCLVVDNYGAPGPAATRGQLLRGRVVLQLDGALCRVHVEPERDTTWKGARTQTTRV